MAALMIPIKHTGFHASASAKTIALAAPASVQRVPVEGVHLSLPPNLPPHNGKCRARSFLLDSWTVMPIQEIGETIGVYALTGSRTADLR